jgi:phosphoserine phosphatase
MHKYTLMVIFFLAIISCDRKTGSSETGKTSVDPLPSWNEGSVKSAIIDYVTTVSKEGPSFIPVEDRIATFDNDGTLWAERPYVQEMFALARVKKMVEQDPTLAKKQPFKAVMEGDKGYFVKGGNKALFELLATTHTGMSEEEFEAEAGSFFSNAMFPGLNVPVRRIRYQPQLELLDFLRSHQFKVYICTGGTIEFVRSISSDFYGVEPDQVIGTSFKYIYVDSSRKVHRELVLDHFNDKGGKPASIQLHIGKKPVLACGNEGGAGDIAMLSYCQSNQYPTLQLLINHDDAAREFAYSEEDSASLKAASAGNWQVVSIKNDWKEVFAKE